MHFQSNWIGNSSESYELLLRSNLVQILQTVSTAIEFEGKYQRSTWVKQWSHLSFVKTSFDQHCPFSRQNWLNFVNKKQCIYVGYELKFCYKVCGLSLFFFTHITKDEWLFELQKEDQIETHIELGWRYQKRITTKWEHQRLFHLRKQN